MQLNQVKLNQVVESAKLKAAGHPRWLAAIERAAEQLVSNPYISETSDGLLILGTSGNIYTANGTCQCRAAGFGLVCWHRAAAQLIKRYREAERENAILVKRAGNVMKIGCWDV
jgi:hypothetical protein